MNKAELDQELEMMHLVIKKADTDKKLAELRSDLSEKVTKKRRLAEEKEADQSVASSFELLDFLNSEC
jgi:hypothetical protein